MHSVVVNSLCHLDWPRGCPDAGKTSLLDLVCWYVRNGPAFDSGDPHLCGWYCPIPWRPRWNTKAGEEQIPFFFSWDAQLLPPLTSECLDFTPSDSDWIIPLPVPFSSFQTRDCGTSQPPKPHETIPLINLLLYLSIYIDAIDSASLRNADIHASEVRITVLICVLVTHVIPIQEFL